MKANLILFAVAAITVISFSTKASTDLTCHNQVSGNWNFGTAPSACSVSSLMNVNEAKFEYQPTFFKDSNHGTQYRRDYMSKMFPILKAMGTYYLKRRNPNVSEAELDGFLESFYALAQQESYWTHYREGTGSILRYMRGDNLHGHGIMQVDDRSHAQALKQGRGVDLVYNFLYGLDIYYAQWKKSASAPCVSSPSNYYDRARSSWAAYNGGSGAICRWKSNGATDRSYEAHLRNRNWLFYVANPAAQSAIDVKCLSEGVRPCRAKSSLSTVGQVAP